MKQTSLRRKLGNFALAVTPRPLWNVYLRARGLPQRNPWRTFGRMQTCADATPLFTGRFAELHERYRGLEPFGGEDYAHPDHGGHAYNGDIAMAARCAGMALDDALWRCFESQMRARQ
jgi:hypothetical protein